MHLLLWMNVMLDFISMIFAELRGMRNQRTNENENICLHRQSNHMYFHIHFIHKPWFKLIVLE